MSTLLYIEDNPVNLLLVETLMESRTDIHLLCSINSSSGIAMAQTALPDVIFLDINLPDISGMEVLKILLADPATAHIPVVALSANAMPHDIRKGLDAGFYRYLTKPFKIDKFMATLDDALSFATMHAVRAASEDGHASQRNLP